MSVIRTAIRPIVMAFVAIAAALAFASAGTSAASAGVVSEIYFDPGTNGGYVAGAVVRGDSDAYFLDAYAGQVMSLSIASYEANAVYDVYTPAGDLICYEETASSIVLPASGEYLVVVSGTRGNATYELDVWIA